MKLMQLLAQAAAPMPTATEDFSLTTGGWVIMVLSVGFVTLLLAWCIYKVVTTPGETEHLHTQADIEPPDVKQA
jgi:di/tricarboxylate transporter